VPLHGWLPMAMVAPAPVSALLHAVAVVKAGAFGIVRVVYDVYGVEFAASRSGAAAARHRRRITILYGSCARCAGRPEEAPRLFHRQPGLLHRARRRMFGPLGTIGGLVHLVHQGIMKITLFFCAGNLRRDAGHPQGRAKWTASAAACR
jgi:multicomponent Na+:H+ antiporter subunit D